MAWAFSIRHCTTLATWSLMCPPLFWVGRVLGKRSLLDIVDQVRAGHNVVLLANHQVNSPLLTTAKWLVSRCSIDW